MHIRRFSIAALMVCLIGPAACGKKDKAGNAEADPKGAAGDETKGTLGDRSGEAPATAAKVDTAEVTVAVAGAGAGLSAADFEVTAGDTKAPASKVVRFADSDRSAAMVVLVEGDEYWMGNDTYVEEDDPDRLEGAFVGLPDAIDQLAAGLPKGAKTALLTYDTEVNVRKPLDDTPLTGAALGEQKGYGDKLGRSLIAGLAEATALLSEAPVDHRFLVVIGNGEGLADDISAELRTAIDKLANLRAAVYTIHYAAVPTDDPVGAANFTKLGRDSAVRAVSRDNLAPLATQLAAEIGSTYYVTFQIPKDLTEDLEQVTIQSKPVDFTPLE